MRNLTDIHHQLSAADQVYLEKQAEQYKIAEEEDAAGRIMARGFADELQKLANPGQGSMFSRAGQAAVAGAAPKPPKPYLPGASPAGERGVGAQRSSGGGASGGLVMSGGYQTNPNAGSNYGLGGRSGANQAAVARAGGSSRSPVGTGQRLARR